MRIRVVAQDLIERDGLVVALANDTVHLLGPLASAVVLECCDAALGGDAAVVDGLVAGIERRVGPAPDGDAAEAIRRCVRELSDAGLVEAF